MEENGLLMWYRRMFLGGNQEEKCVQGDHCLFLLLEGRSGRILSGLQNLGMRASSDVLGSDGSGQNRSSSFGKDSFMKEGLGHWRCIRWQKSFCRDYRVE